jgi:hypothetical protein
MFDNARFVGIDNAVCLLSARGITCGERQKRPRSLGIVPDCW